MRPSALDPQGPGARTIADVWWFLFWTALVVLVVMLTLIGLSALRGRGEDPDAGSSPSRPFGLDERTFITIGGVIVPMVILTAVAIVTVVSTRSLQAAPRGPLRVQVVGADWFWRVSYPDSGVTTANEIVVPVGRPVEVALESEDVIHSFWVPQLIGKTDLIPGSPNTTSFTAEVAGSYRGQCAEFCGIQHADMAFFVRAMPADEFDAWLDARRDAPPAPTDPQLAAGRSAFESLACAGCHTVAGTSARGTVGPDLTDVGSRRTLAAGTIANTPDELRRWILDPQGVKPGNRMPAVQVAPAQLDALVAYLESLDQG